MSKTNIKECSIGECKKTPIQLLRLLDGTTENRCENHYWVTELDEHKYKSKERL